jgi:hypothetical protein
VPPVRPEHNRFGACRPPLGRCSGHHLRHARASCS